MLMLILLLWSVVLGWGLAQATKPSSTPLATGQSPTTLLANIDTVDPVPARYQLGQRLYLENCSTCHVAVPPAVLPSETWRLLLQDPQHYGTQLTPLIDPPRLLVWEYLLNYSRPLLEGEETPFRLSNSRYFKALHPLVDLPQPARLGTCISCHPGAPEFNYRRLAPESAEAS